MDAARQLLLLAVSFIVDYVSAQAGVLLCANKRTLRKLDLETKSYTDIVTNLQRSVAIDYHYEKNIVLWTDVVLEKICSSPLDRDGPMTTLVEVCVTPDGLAVDWIHDNLYWTDTGKDVIGVSRLDGTFVTTLFRTGLDEPRAIVLDPAEGLMFWTDWGTSPKIERAGMDGTQRAVVTSSRVQWPNGLAIDLKLKTLYWADGRTHVLTSASYDGRNLRHLIDSPSIVKHPFSLDFLGEWLYWTEWSSLRESVYRANRTSGGQVEQVVGGSQWSSLMGLRAYSPTKQPTDIVNRCRINNGGCTHLCLPGPSNRTVHVTCKCPDGLMTDECSLIPMSMASVEMTTAVAPVEKSDVEAFGNSTNERHNQAMTGSAGPFGEIIGTILGLASLALILFYVHQKFWKKGSQAALRSEGWTGLDNSVYSKTTEGRIDDV